MCDMTGATARYGEPAMSDPAGSTSTRAGRGDEARQALLAAAHDLLATEGPAALSVRRIAAAAGMSTMNLYSRFGGKDGVLDELFIDGFQRMAEEMADAPTTDDPVADLISCGRAYRQFARRNPTYYSLMFDRVVPDYRPSPAALDAALGGLGRVVARVERAIAAGKVREGDPFQIAAALWACDHGLASLELRTDVGDDAQFDWDAIGDIAVEAIVRGLAP
jgi:AcrR family transcriptional regulator